MSKNELIIGIPKSKKSPISLKQKSDVRVVYYDSTNTISFAVIKSLKEKHHKETNATDDE